MCYDRIQKKETPACIEACPEEATIFGPRDEILAKARKRLADKKYVQKIYGEKEVGGTAVLYISDVPLDSLGCKPNLDETALPDLTWASLKKVPSVVVGMTGLMGGIYWVIGRRMRMQELEAAQRAKAETETEPAPEDNEEKP
jgi:formate dehydrogenase iron-sulfur subunit